MHAEGVGGDFMEGPSLLVRGSDFFNPGQGGFFQPLLRGGLASFLTSLIRVESLKK